MVWMLRLSFLANSREGGDRVTTVDNGDIPSRDLKLVMSDSASIHVEGWAKLV